MLLESSTNVVDDETVFVILEVKLAEHFSFLNLLLEQCENLAARIEIFDQGSELAHTLRLHQYSFDVCTVSLVNFTCFLDLSCKFDFFQKGWPHQ